MSATSNYFKKYPDFVFNDPSRVLHSTNYKVFDGITNSEGDASVSFMDPPITKAPGMLKANFITKAFEPGGNFSKI